MVEVKGKGVVIFGGITNDSTCSNDSFLYNERDNTWTLLPTDSKPKGRSGHLAAVIQGGGDTLHKDSYRLLIAYGVDGDKRKLNDMYILDLDTLKWEKVTYSSETPSVTFTTCIGKDIVHS